MNEITIPDNPYFDFLPSRRLGWYILVLIDITSIFALVLTGEFYLGILVTLLTLALLPTLIAIIRARKKKPLSLHIKVDGQKIFFRYADQQAILDRDIIKSLIMSPDTSGGKHNMRITLVCKCNKKDKTILTGLPLSLFYGHKLQSLENFLHSQLPETELIFFDTTEI